jgi:hypothetical protein
LRRDVYPAVASRHDDDPGRRGELKGATMHYIILIYGDEKNFAMMADDPKAQEQMYAAFTRYGGDMQAAGVLRGGAELKPTHSATTSATARP